MFRKTEKHGDSSINVFKLWKFYGKFPLYAPMTPPIIKVMQLSRLRLAKTPLIKYPHYKSEANSEEKSVNMTTVFREIPSNYWLFLFATDENRESQKEGNSVMPLSVAEMLETLTNSNDCRFIYRKHKNGENSDGELNDFCQSMPSNHSHILFYLPQFSGAEKLIKQSVSQTLSNVENAKVKLLTVSNPENFIKTETPIFHDESLIIRGERLQKLIKVKTTETLGCKFVSSWEIEKVNSLENSAESEKPLYIFQKFLELEKSDVPFKDTIISYINLLQRRMGRLFVTEHSRTLDIDLGVSNAQCICYEFLYQPLPETQDDQSKNCQLFPLFNEDTIFDTSFL